MKRLMFLILILAVPLSLHAQNTVIEVAPLERTFDFTASGNSACYPVPDGVGYFTIRWDAIGTVSAGTLKLIGSDNDQCSSSADIITAQTATSDGAVIQTAGVARFVRMVTASQAGSGHIRATVLGVKSAGASFTGEVTNGGTFAVQSSVADGANVAIGDRNDDKSTATDTTAVTLISLAKEISYKIQALADGTATTTASNQCFGSAHSTKRYISTGATDDESQVKATAGTLCSIIASNSHATSAAYVKCTNLTAANTTPGSSAIYFDFLVPAASTAGIANIDLPFDTALTCYIVLSKAENAVDEVAATDVRYTLTYQ
jgi:hypothetical protein